MVTGSLVTEYPTDWNPNDWIAYAGMPSLFIILFVLSVLSVIFKLYRDLEIWDSGIGISVLLWFAS